MKTDTFSILKYSFLLALLLSVTGALMKIYGMGAGNILLTIGIIATFVYMITALIEIFNSRKINTSEKLMWLVGFLFFNLLTGILYIFSARKRIVGVY